MSTISSSDAFHLWEELHEASKDTELGLRTTWDTTAGTFWDPPEKTIKVVWSLPEYLREEILHDLGKSRFDRTYTGPANASQKFLSEHLKVLKQVREHKLQVKSKPTRLNDVGITVKVAGVAEFKALIEDVIRRFS